MEIKVSFTADEVREIIKAHVLKGLPVDEATSDIHVVESYGRFTVEITKKEKDQ